MRPQETLDILLMQDGAVTPAQARHARILHAQIGGFLGDQFLSLGYITQERLVLAISRQLGLAPAEDAVVISASRALATVVPPAWVRQWRAVPFSDEPDLLQVAFYDPASRHGFAQLQASARKPVRLLVASEPAVESAIARLYPLLAPLPAAPTAPLLSETPRAVTMGLKQPVAEPPPGHPLHIPRNVTMRNLPAVLPPPRPTGLSDAIRDAFPDVESSPEIPNDNFAAALELEDPKPEPELLFRKKPTPVPILLTRKKEPIKRIGNVGEAAELCFSAESVARMGTAGVGFLLNFFPRAALFDLGKHPSDVVTSQGFAHEVLQWNLAGMTVLRGLMTSRRAFYGAASEVPEWAMFHAAVGDPQPESILVLPVFAGDRPRLLLYADAPTSERYDDIKDMETLAREMGLAAEALGI